MCNVIIVDDEPVTRFGLKASINWEEEGLTFIGDFSNGEMALNELEKTPIDILITDIKMPVMDGLTLMKKALEMYPKLKVILVSSYNDFEYVREGLQYGAMDYVLKPTLEPSEFLQLIKKCVKKTEEEQAIDDKLALFNQSELLQERKRIEQELRTILLNNEDDTNEEHLPDWMEHAFLVVYAKMNHAEVVEEQQGMKFKSLFLEEIQERFYLNKEDGICLIIGNSELLFLLKNVSTPERVIGKIKREALEQFNLSFSFGFTVISNLFEIKQGFERSRSACLKHFFYPDKDIFKFSESINCTRQTKPLKKEQLKHYILPFNEEKVMTFINDRYKYWKEEETDPSKIKQEANDILTTLFIEKLDLSLLLDKCSEQNKTESLDELVKLLINQIKECNRLISEKRKELFRDNELIDSALDYIHENYTGELNLQVVADHIHISRNYFSILFKRIYNQNFIDYVIDLRIKKAKELLMHTPLKVYEIAKESGFKDVKYFSKLFKKMTGFSPVDYRAEHQKEWKG